MDCIFKSHGFSFFKLCKSSDDNVNLDKEFSVLIKTPMNCPLVVFIALGFLFGIVIQIFLFVRVESRQSI